MLSNLNMSGEHFCRLLDHVLHSCLSEAVWLGLIQGEF